VAGSQGDRTEPRAASGASIPSGSATDARESSCQGRDNDRGGKEVPAGEEQFCGLGGVGGGKGAYQRHGGE